VIAATLDGARSLTPADLTPDRKKKKKTRLTARHRSIYASKVRSGRLTDGSTLAPWLVSNLTVNLRVNRTHPLATRSEEERLLWGGATTHGVHVVHAAKRVVLHDGCVELRGG
jgi:hypothetical protein